MPLCALKGTVHTNFFIGLKVSPLPTDQGVIGEKSDKSLKKIEKCVFVKFLGSQNCLTDEKMALKKALPDGNLALKYHYQTRIGLSNIITGREFGCQYLLNRQTFGSVLEGLGWSWRFLDGPGGSGRVQEGSGGSGGLAWSGRVLEDPRKYKRVWKGMGGLGRVWEGLGGSGRVKEGLEVWETLGGWGAAQKGPGGS